MKGPAIVCLLALAAQSRGEEEGTQMRRLRREGAAPVITSSTAEADALSEDFFYERDLAGSMSMSMPPAPTPPPNLIPPSPTPILCPPLSNEERELQILELLVEISDLGALEDPAAPQFKAADWLVNRDPYKICPNNLECPNKLYNRYVAALLYYSTGGEDWTNCGAEEDGSDCITTGIPPAVPPCIGGGNRWLSGADECSWCGNSCANEEDWDPPSMFPGCDTTDIQLESINQSGVLPSELGVLDGMRTIRMENGNIGGSLPQEWANMDQLRRLDLNFQKLIGTIPTTYFTGNTLLVQLDLNNNGLVGTIPSEIDNLLDLEFIQLGDNLLNGNLPATVGNLESLKLLDVQNNNFVGDVPSSFASTVLQEINLKNNDFSGGIGFLGNLGSVDDLTKVDLSQNEFTGPIPLAMENAANLEFFDVSFNFLTGAMPPGMEDLNIDYLSSDCATPVRVDCPFCTLCTRNP